MSALDEILTTPDSLDRLNRGKYTDWIKRLDADDLRVVLWAIGKYASVHDPWQASVRLYTNLNPFLQGNISGSWRFQHALDYLATVQGPCVLNTPFLIFVVSAYSNIKPAFAKDFRKELSIEKNTAWARNLNEREFVQVLWMTGEFAMRNVGYMQFHTGEVDDLENLIKRVNCEGPALASLIVILKIIYGYSMNIDEARQFLSDFDG